MQGLEFNLQNGLQTSLYQHWEKKKPFPIKEPIKDEGKIKEHSMGKVLKLLKLLL